MKKNKIRNINISKEIKQSFLDYSMSVIVSRALPDVRDGLKPVHRRILYSMYADGTTPDKNYKKSATTVGSVMGSFHPHGDSAIYGTMVRMAQDFSYRHPLIDGKGGFGSQDGGEAAAYRYTEARLEKISMELLKDINKDSVDFVDNFDGSKQEPTVLPSKFPNILVNGNMGIAVGMATNIPPHNMGESIDAAILCLENPDITISELMEVIHGPDFPTGGSILGNSGIKKAFETGRGIAITRGTAAILENNGKNQIIISEVPYQVNFTNIITKIALMVKNKELEGVSNLTDLSALEGIKIIVDVKPGYNPNVLLNNLYKHTQLQVSFGINYLMLVDGRPKTLNIKEILDYYLNHQKTVIIRRTQFDLTKAEFREHILRGFILALANIDAIISLIRESVDEVKLLSDMTLKFSLTEIQAKEILEMRLKRLSALEASKLEEELSILMKLIDDLKDILGSEERVKEIIKNEMLEIKNKYSEPRKTIIDMTAIEYIDDESLIPVDNIIVTLTNNGYIKRIDEATYKVQNRGGVGIKGMTTNTDDDVENMISLTTHDYLLFFSSLGKVYRTKGYEIPLYSRTAKGLPIVNLLPLDEGEEINSLLKVTDENDEKLNIVFCTQRGLIKRVALSEFSKIRESGKIAVTLKDGDNLISVNMTSGDKDIMICTEMGQMIRFDEERIRKMGRTAAGVKGITLNTNDSVIGCEIIDDDDQVLVITENGYAKRTFVNAYRVTNRGGKGVKTINITEKNGKIVRMRKVSEENEIIIISDNGIIIRVNCGQISLMGRVTQGVRVIDLRDGQKVVAVSILTKGEEEIDTPEEV